MSLLDALLQPNVIIGGGGSTDAVKDPVKGISTANIALSGTPTINGTVFGVGDDIGVLAQTDGRECGIYTVGSPWVRRADFGIGSTVLSGCQFTVTTGTYAGATVTVTTPDDIVIGTSALSFAIATFTDTTGESGKAVTVVGGITTLAKIGDTHITDATISPSKLSAAGGTDGQVLGRTGGVLAWLSSAGHALKNELGAAVTARANLLASWFNIGDDGTNSILEEHERLARVNVTVVPTANLSNLASISASQNGVTCARGDVLWLVNQTTTSENGFYRYDTGGILTRITEVDALSNDGNGVYVRVKSGTSGKAAHTYWRVTGTGATQASSQMRKPRYSFARAHIEDYQLSTENLVAGSENYQPAHARALECLTKGELELTRRPLYRITTRLKCHRPVTLIGNGFERGTGILAVGCAAFKCYAKLTTNTSAPDSLGPGAIEKLTIEYSGTFSAATCHLHGVDTLAGISIQALIFGFPGHGLRIYGDASAPDATWNSNANIGGFSGAIFSCGLNGVDTQGADGNNWKFQGALFANNGLLLVHAAITNGSAFDNAAWTKGAGVTVTPDVDTLTAATADALVVSGAATSANTYVTQTPTTYAANATENPPLHILLTTRYVDVQWICIETDVGAAANRTWFDIQNGVVGTSGINHAISNGAARAVQAGPAISAVGATIANYRDITLGMAASASGTAVYRIYLCAADNSLTPPATGGIVRAMLASVEQFADWNADCRDFLGSYFNECNFQASPGVIRSVGASQNGGFVNCYSEFSAGGGVDIRSPNLIIAGRGMGVARTANGYVAGTQAPLLSTSLGVFLLPNWSQSAGAATQTDVLHLLNSSSDSTGYYSKYNYSGGNSGLYTQGRGNTNSAQNRCMGSVNESSLGAGQMGYLFGLFLGKTFRMHALARASLPATGVLHAIGGVTEGSWPVGSVAYEPTPGKAALGYRVLTNSGSAAYNLTWGAIANPSPNKVALATGDQTRVITDGGWFTMAANTLAGNSNLTLGTTSALKGDVMRFTIETQLTTTFSLTLTNGGAGGGAFVLTANATGYYADFEFDGTNWLRVQCYELFA